MLDCHTDFRKLRRRIFEGTKPYVDRSKRFSRLLRDIRRFGDSCGYAAEVLEVQARQVYGIISTDEAIKLGSPLAEDLRTPVYARIAAFARCAALAYKNPAWTVEQELDFRLKALKLAKEHGQTFEAFVVLTNWLFAATYNEDLPKSEQILNEIESLGEISHGRRKEERDDYREWQSRYQTHRAKYFLLKARSAEPQEGKELVLEAHLLYEAAIKGETRDDHRRVNFYIEWANRLIDLAQKRTFVKQQKISDILEVAYRSFDSHGCDLCRAYYFETLGGLRELEGDKLFNTDRAAALRHWRESLKCRRMSMDLYNTAHHHFTEEESEFIQTMEKKLTTEESPQKIFLSHKGVDKAMIRRFYGILEELGYQPWLDDVELTAVKRIHRYIQKGFKQSCACVFFVTEMFKDEKYIAAEIDYANAEYIERGEGEFAVITIAFGDATVPDSLRRWVYKTCEFELQALLEVVRALPVRVGAVHSRKTTLTLPDA